MKKTIKNMIKKMHLRKLTLSNNAVVGIVVAVLLIGLLVSVISIIQAAYIPKWMEEREADHIERVLVQFSELKLAIDTHSITRENNTPIATSITLGSKEFPFLMSTRAYGSLEIIDDACIIDISYYGWNNTTSDWSFSNSSEYELGIIKYNSHNAYYIPEEKQSFVYEAGAVITSQTSGNSISVKPPFSPIKTSSDEKSISLKIINITSYAEKTEYGGYDTVPILTEYDGSAYNNSINYTNALVRFINITSYDYPYAWFTFLNSSLKKAGYIYCDTYNTGFEPSDDYYIDFDSEDSTKIFIEFNDSPKLKLTEIGILAQIGPGWVD